MKRKERFVVGVCLALVFGMLNPVTSFASDPLKAAQDTVRQLETKDSEVEKLLQILNSVKSTGGNASSVAKAKASLDKALSDKAEALSKASAPINTLYKSNRNLESSIKSYLSLMATFTAAQKKVKDFQNAFDDTYSALASLKPNELRVKYLIAKTALEDVQDFYDTQLSLYELDTSDVDSKDLLDKIGEDLQVAQKAYDLSLFALLSATPGMEISPSDQKKILDLRASIYQQQNELNDLNAQLEEDSTDEALTTKVQTAADALGAAQAILDELETNLIPDLADDDSDEAVMDAQSAVKRAFGKLTDSKTTFTRTRTPLINRENAVKSNAKLRVILKAIRFGVKISS